jgi:hypothetical protein
MTPEQIAKTRIIAYTPSYIKTALIDYVTQHPDITVSKFVKDAVRQKLIEVGAISKLRRVPLIRKK